MDGWEKAFALETMSPKFEIETEMSLYALDKAFSEGGGKTGVWFTLEHTFFPRHL